MCLGDCPQASDSGSDFAHGNSIPETHSPAEKADIMNRFKAAIEALPATIPFIRGIHVGLNENPAEVWDICLDSSFDTLDDVKAYAIHPAHVAAAGILKDAKENRACVDYTI